MKEKYLSKNEGAQWLRTVDEEIQELKKRIKFLENNIYPEYFSFINKKEILH